MKTFIVATPLFDFRMAVQGYRLKYRNGEKLFGALDDHLGFTEALSSPGLDLLQQTGVEPFAGEFPVFVDVNEYQLLMGVPTNYKLDPRSLVVVLSNDVKTDAESISRIEMLKNAGYGLAFSGVPNDQNAALVDLAEHLILDHYEINFSELINTLTRHVRRKRIIVDNVPSMDAFDKLGTFTNILYGGTFYSQPIMGSGTEISPLKLNAINLMNIINQEDFDLTQIAQTIERDPSLSISLLRFINNSSLGRTRQIDSIRSAVAILGQKEVKRWATVAISVQLADDRPSEVTRLSLIRAKFAENLAPFFELGILAPTLFMCGLFSMLDVILQRPMDQALKEVAVDDRVRATLLDRTGELAGVMELIYAYESADWDKASILMVRNGINIQDLNSTFVDTLLWYRQLLDSISEDNDEYEAVEE